MKIEVTDHGSYRSIALADPDTRNAMTAELKLELMAALDTFEQDDSKRCLVLTGSNGIFSAGGDIKSFRGGRILHNRNVLVGSHKIIEKIREIGKPVITAINGPAVGAGFGLAMLGDLVVASTKAYFLPGFPALGLVPDWALGLKLRALIGEKRTLDILLTNRRVGANEARDLGMISRVFADEDFPAEVGRLAEEVATGPTAAFGLTKALVSAAATSPLDEYLAMESAFQAIAMETEDHAEGLAAFRDKRKPIFAGR